MGALRVSCSGIPVTIREGTTSSLAHPDTVGTSRLLVLCMDAQADFSQSRGATPKSQGSPVCFQPLSFESGHTLPSAMGLVACQVSPVPTPQASQPPGLSLHERAPSGHGRLPGNPQTWRRGQQVTPHTRCLSWQEHTPSHPSVCEIRPGRRRGRRGRREAGYHHCLRRVVSA